MKKYSDMDVLKKTLESIKGNRHTQDVDDDDFCGRDQIDVERDHYTRLYESGMISPEEMDDRMDDLTDEIWRRK